MEKNKTIINLEKLTEAINSVEETLQDYNEIEKKLIIQNINERINNQIRERLTKDLSQKNLETFLPKKAFSFLNNHMGNNDETSND